MYVRGALAALAVVALGAAPLANAQSIPAGSLGSTQAQAPAPAGTNKATVDGDNSTGCAVNWEAKSENARVSGDSDLYKDADGKPVNSPANGGFISELSSGFKSVGDLQMQHWISGTTSFWRTPIATHVPIGDAKLVIEFQANTYTAEPTFEDVGVSFFSTREEAFNMKDYTWDALPAVDITGDVATGFTATITLGDLDALHGYGVQFSGTVAEDLAKQEATATLTGTYPVGTESCTILQDFIGGTPLGSLSGSLAGLGS